MNQRGMNILMAFVFVVTSVAFFIGVFKGFISIPYIALYFGWICYWGIYLLLVIVDKKHEQRVLKEVKKKR